MRGALTGAVALLAACAASPSWAMDTLWPFNGFWYLGGSVGFTKADARLGRFSNVPNPCVTVDCRTSIDDDSVSVGLLGGYQFNEHVAAEVAFANLPHSYTVRQEDPRFPSPALLAVDQDSQAYTLRGVFTLPMRELGSHPVMDRVSLSGVLGLTHWRSDAEFVSDVTGAGGGIIRADRSENGFDLSLGARINYDINDEVRISGTWDRYLGLGNSNVAVPRSVPPLTVNTVRSPVDVYSLGVIYRFR